MTATDAIRALIAPALAGWRMQLGRWDDGAPTDRFAVLRPAGGPKASIVRRPQFTLMLIGAKAAPATAVQAKAEEIYQLANADRGTLVLIEAGEPVFFSTDEGRPVFELAISTITN